MLTVPWTCFSSNDSVRFVCFFITDTTSPQGRNVPFETKQDLLDHFSDHGHQFGVSIVEDYERLADTFMFGPRGPNVEECVRPQGGFARYDTVTQEYGTVDRRGFLNTYFIPDPAIHGYRDNLTYFRVRCR